MTQPTFSAQTSLDEAKGNRFGRLKKWFGLFGVITISFGSIGLVQANYFTTAILPGFRSDTYFLWQIGIAAIVSLILLTLFSAFGAIIPRSGADYLVTSRSLPAPLAFGSSFTFVLGSSIVAGLFLANISRLYLPALVQTISIVTRNESVAGMAQLASMPQGISIVGTVILVLAFLSIFSSPRNLKISLRVGFFVTLLAFGIVLYFLANFNNLDFPSVYNQVYGQALYEQQLSTVYGLSVKFVPNNLMGTIMTGMLLSIWLFFGIGFTGSISGEIFKPQKNLWVGNFLALVTATAVLILGGYLVNRLVGEQFFGGLSFLYLLDQNLPDYIIPWLPYYSAIFQSSQILLWAIAVGIFVSMFNLVQVFLFTLSRVTTIWAYDQLMPETVASIQKGKDNPLIGLLIVSSGMLIGLIDAAQAGPLTSNFNIGLFFAVSWIVPSIALVVFPFLRKDLFVQAKGWVEIRLFGFPLVSLLGLLAAVYFGWVIVYSYLGQSFVDPRLGNTIAVIIGLFVLGVGWYSFQAYLKKWGIWGKEHFRNLPEMESEES